MNVGCLRCGRHGWVRAHGYLRGYDTGADHDNEYGIRGLRFFVLTDTQTKAAVKLSRYSGIR